MGKANLKKQENSGKKGNTKFYSKKRGLSKKQIVLFFLLGSLITGCGIYFYSIETSLYLDEALKGEKIYLSHEPNKISGEFGKLEITPIIIQPKSEYFSKFNDPEYTIELIKSEINWTFVNSNIDLVKSIFQKAELSENIIEVLLKNSTLIPYRNCVVIHPPDSIIIGLSQKARLNIYGYLENSENPLFFKPFHFISANAEDWFVKSTLNSDAVNVLAKLVYSVNGINYLSDLHLVAPYLNTKEDWNHLFQVLYRISALEVNLRINEGEDISHLVEYWGNLERTDDIESKLNLLKSRKGGGTIDIQELLPPISKQRLNTYLSFDEANKNTRDCLWTMFNFFNSKSDERFALDVNKPALFGQISKEVKSKNQLRFGDMIILQDKNDNVFHGCVYIAPNIVYTKNGMMSYSSNSPFIFSEYDKMLKLYKSGQEIVNIHTFNRTWGPTNNLDISIAQK